MPLSLAAQLSLERRGAREFTARLRDYGGVSFGGDVIGRAVLAASADCEGKDLHALHVSFLRPVPPEQAVRLRVEALADGRRLARRRVQIDHAGRLLCDVTASFAAHGDGVAWQDSSPPIGVEPPEVLPTDEEIAREMGWDDWSVESQEIEWRWVGRPFDAAKPGESASWLAWARPRVPLPDDPRVHSAALAFVSDYQSHGCVRRRLGDAFEWEGFASAEHALFVHRIARWDDYWLLTNESDVASGGRSFWRREIWTRDGRLVASIAQHGLVATLAAPAR